MEVLPFGGRGCGKNINADCMTASFEDSGCEGDANTAPAACDGDCSVAERKQLGYGLKSSDQWQGQRWNPWLALEKLPCELWTRRIKLYVGKCLCNREEGT